METACDTRCYNCLAAAIIRREWAWQKVVVVQGDSVRRGAGGTSTLVPKRGPPSALGGNLAYLLGQAMYHLSARLSLRPSVP